MNQSVGEQIFRPLAGDTFFFRCHRDVPCFTQCCARLRLILTPYDILRMKNRLKIGSDEFLERYTDTVMDNRSRFPRVRLKMRPDRKHTCPFVTQQGCSIYEDRPEACRLYPLGRATATVEGEKGARERFFMVAESHCHGFSEDRAWTLEEWMEHEGVNEFSALNHGWLGIITSSRSLGPREYEARKQQMFFMASYNLDRFRDFLFGSAFFDRFHVDPALREALKKDDTALMLFGFDWLRFSLFGEKTLEPRLKKEDK
ncbi:MAG: YkgJ family cysteine cluster protein [Deltaproteobacteria bacterium]|nr:YkgJ family cysteine cluster protein [Deltaproteobacteria bacterium]MBW2112912.1 YkgJ family cysteine cluster protein [Deltaproteobacteria bacterium]MBW2355010.1 YkgJ family cysteine cluster protein [Deltaproteobacteria bacterium]HDZ89135.1 YkgJ family cysteine cluster protein [Deltaproteobacteria bacterium]